MKKFRALLTALLFPASLLAQAQTETVSSEPKKLQQLYLSVGTGPALTTHQESRANGGSYQANITADFGSCYIFRGGIQKTSFTAAQANSPNIFDYLSEFSYSGTFATYNESKSISLSLGKKKKLNELVQLQTLGGISVNYIQTFEYIDPEIRDYIFCVTPETYLKPGLLLQAEAMFLPSRFAGLTAGAYMNLTPKLPSAGVNLSLNLGKLK